MKYSLKPSFARLVLALFVAILALSLIGRSVSLTKAWLFCTGWPMCLPNAPVGWLKLLHILVAGTAGVLVVLVLRQAWREYRSERVVLPLASVTSVLFIGQAFTGAILVIRAYPEHLLILHAVSSAALWISLLTLVLVSGNTSQVVEKELLSTSPKRKEGETRIDTGYLLTAIQVSKDFFLLTKPVIVALLLVTTYAGLVAGTRALPSFTLTFWTMVGGALAAGGSSALNQYIDRELDKRMQRTSRRPLAEGRLTPAEGLSFGLALCLFSYFIMAGFVNPLAALLSLAGIIYYVLFYSIWLKKATVQNIVIGGGAGAIPPMVGWAAATGNLSLGAWILFAIVFMWTPPHFWALAIVRKNDYARAGVPMMPVIKGERETRRQILIYTFELVAVTLLLPIFNLAGGIYLAAALVLGGAMIYAAWRLWKNGGIKLTWRLYRWSSMYLAFIFLAIVVDVLV